MAQSARMTYTQFRMALAKLDMTQAYFGELIGMEPRGIRCYALNERKVSRPVQALIHLLLQKKIRPHDLETIWRKVNAQKAKD